MGIAIDSAVHNHWLTSPWQLPLCSHCMTMYS